MNERFPLRLGVALGILSASIIACQLALMKVLAFIQWHHFAYMIISIAMLGFGAAGTTVSLFRKRLLENKDTLLPVLSVAAGISLELMLRLTSSDFFVFDLYHLFIERSQFWKLGANLIIYFLPFFFAALAIGILFTAWVSEIGKLYFANLFGSGIGGLLALLLLANFYPWQVLSICAFLAMAAGLLMVREFRSGLMRLLPVVVILSFAFSQLWPVQVVPSQYKGLSKTLNLPEAEIIYQEPGIYGISQVVTSPVLRYAPGIGLSYQGEIPVKPAVFTNAEFTGVLSHRWNQEPNPADYTTFALPFHLCKPDTVLVINAGTGSFVAQALRRGATQITATEPDRKLVQLVQTGFAELSDSIYNHPFVRLQTIEARTYLASAKQKYDLAVLPVMDAFGGTSGLYAMQENYTLTVEGFRQIWDQLKPDGCLTISSWMDYPIRTPLKIAATLMEVFNHYQVADPGQHLAAIKSWGTITFVMSKSPFTDEQLAATHSFCDSLFFDPVLLPGLNPDERNRYNIFSDTSFFYMLDDIVAGNRNYVDYAFYIEPSTDNRPYFNQFIRLRSLPVLSVFFGQENLPFLELGYLILFITLLQVTFLAVILVVLPLFKLKTGMGSKLPVLLYFSALGLGYMFIEIILIQRFVLYFGNPVIAASVVISIMLMASGAGSYFSSRLTMSRKTLAVVAALIVFCGVLLLLGLNPLLRATGGVQIVVKSIVALFSIAVPAFFMGMPFPLGLKAISKNQENVVPWAWGINGCLSVIASPLAILIAVEAGFTWVMVVAVAAYFIALLVSGNLLLDRKEKLSA